MGVSAETFEGDGATVEEATLAACRAAGLERDGVMVEVVSEGGAAIPGERISGATARVRVQAIPPEGVKGKRNLEVLLQLMDIAAEVYVRRVRPSTARSASVVRRSPPVTPSG